MQNNFPFISILVISCLLIFQSRKKKKDIFLWLSGFTNSNKSYYQEKYTGSYLQRWIFAVLFPDAYKILLFIRFCDLNILFCRCIIWISIILTVLAIACFLLFNLYFFFFQCSLSRMSSWDSTSDSYRWFDAVIDTLLNSEIYFVTTVW